jgi:hypothetical protein
MYEQPWYAANDWCVLCWSYKGANDWKIFQLEPVNEEEENGARDSIRCELNTFAARISLMIREGEVGAVGTTAKSCNGRASRTHCKRTLKEYRGLLRQEQWWLTDFILIGFSEHHIGTRSRRK